MGRLADLLQQAPKKEETPQQPSPGLPGRLGQLAAAAQAALSQVMEPGLAGNKIPLPVWVSEVPKSTHLEPRELARQLGLWVNTPAGRAVLLWVGTEREYAYGEVDVELQDGTLRTFRWNEIQSLQEA